MVECRHSLFERTGHESYASGYAPGFGGRRGCAGFGPDRVVFGGDWPVCLKRAKLAEWIAAEGLPQRRKERKEDAKKSKISDRTCVCSNQEYGGGISQRWRISGKDFCLASVPELFASSFAASRFREFRASA
jgi:hypothetical protein